MKICVIGCGYVGLVTGVCFAEMGNDVVCMDVDRAKIDALRQGLVPIYEPGLEEMLRRNLREGRLGFTSDLGEAVEPSELFFIAVGTPEGTDGSTDLSYVLEAAAAIGERMTGYGIIVNKSTVPVGTADRVREIVGNVTSHEFDVVSNPEFLKEGAAVEDFMRPDRIVVGSFNSRAAESMRELYAPFVRTGAPILFMDCRSAEMTKYVANAMLATRISFMNEMANLSEHLGADIHWVRQGVGADRRIGPSFLFPGVGYGGSCFPKDVRSLISVGRQHGYSLKVMQAVEEVNEFQKRLLVEKMIRFYALKSELGAGSGESVETPHRAALPVSGHAVSTAAGKIAPFAGKTFAVWGLSFKPQTDDMREAASRVIVQRLMELGARVRVYDPQALKEARRVFGEGVEYCANNYAALDQADALLVVTEWNMFRRPDFARMRKLLKHPVIFDGRNQYDPEEMRSLGFRYFAIGRP